MHSRYRTDSHDSVQPRFNERFILSLGNCPDCLVLDDELNVLPISKGKDIVALEGDGQDKGRKRNAEELLSMKESLEGVKVVGALGKLAKTVDQVSLCTSLADSRPKRCSRSSRLSQKRHYRRPSP